MSRLTKEESKHLTKTQRMRMGSFYTPQKLVAQVYDLIRPYAAKHRDNVVILDNAAGGGAFIPADQGLDIRVADIDSEACQFLQSNYPYVKTYCRNALVQSERSGYDISDDAFLIQVGNPPYNDTTSQFRNGQKGRNECDPYLFDRDLGVSFLKSYHSLQSDLVCVLHPLSYLIKPINFERLGRFRQEYVLKRGLIFSSAYFSGTGNLKFPIVIALYERDSAGMDWSHILNFKFELLDFEKKFVLSEFETTDGYINKYPPRSKDPKISDIGVYYYTFRDLNSLRKNASFISEPHYNAVVVSLSEFYKYAYLFTLKSLFSHETEWLFGNVSPLVNPKVVEQNKKLYVHYALARHPLFNKIGGTVVDRIRSFYSVEGEFDSTSEETIRHQIRKFYSPRSDVKQTILYSRAGRQTSSLPFVYSSKLIKKVERR